MAPARRAEWEAREREKHLWKAKRRTDTARQLAEHADFARCKREADRVYLLAKLLGEAVSANAPW